MQWRLLDWGLTPPSLLDLPKEKGGGGVKGHGDKFLPCPWLGKLQKKRKGKEKDGGLSRLLGAPWMTLKWERTKKKREKKRCFYPQHEREKNGSSCLVVIAIITKREEKEKEGKKKKGAAGQHRLLNNLKELTAGKKKGGQEGGE